MNSKIALSAVSIFAALAIVGGATFAYFTDVGSSTNNVFGVGSIDLRLANGAGTATDSVTGTIGGSNLVPGHTPIVSTLNIRNDGTVAANHIDIDVTDVVSQASSGPGTDPTHQLDKYLKLTSLTYDGNNILDSVTDHNVNGIIDLDDLINNNLSGGDLHNLPTADIGSNHPLVIGIQLDGSAPNDLQGDSVNMTLTLTLDQAPPSP